MFGTNLGFKRVIVMSLATLALVSASLPAEARGGRRAAAVVGGLAAGALLGGVIAGSRAYGGPAYAEEVDDEPVPVRRCWRERQAVYDEDGDFDGYRVVRICR